MLKIANGQLALIAPISFEDCVKANDLWFDDMISSEVRDFIH